MYYAGVYYTGPRFIIVISQQIGAFSARYFDEDYGYGVVPDISIPYDKQSHHRSTWHFYDKDKAEWFEILSRRLRWQVVMRVVVIHGPRSVHTSGLFSILGNAPVQMVDDRDRARIHAMYNLAEAYERSSSVEVKNRKRSASLCSAEASQIDSKHVGGKSARDANTPLRLPDAAMRDTNSCSKRNVAKRARRSPNLAASGTSHDGHE
jgi:hypothetical protein